MIGPEKQQVAIKVESESESESENEVENNNIEEKPTEPETRIMSPRVTRSMIQAVTPKIMERELRGLKTFYNKEKDRTEVNTPMRTRTADEIADLTFAELAFYVEGMIESEGVNINELIESYKEKPKEEIPKDYISTFSVSHQYLKKHGIMKMNGKKKNGEQQ